MRRGATVLIVLAWMAAAAGAAAQKELPRELPRREIDGIRKAEEWWWGPGRLPDSEGRWSWGLDAEPYSELRQKRSEEVGRLRSSLLAVRGASGLAPGWTIQEALKSLGSGGEDKIVYDDDGRVDVYVLGSSTLAASLSPAHRGTLDAMRENARCVAGIFPASRIDEYSDGTYTLQLVGSKLCSGERFARQRVGPIGTAFLVAPDIVVTAAHCVPEAVEEMYFVFDFAIPGEGMQPEMELGAERVYKGEKIEEIARTVTGADWALIRLTRVVSGRPVATLSRSEVVLNDELYMIGHPSGLPLKIAPHGFVTRSDDGPRFSASLDAFEGNSGSPVFSAYTNEVVGILVGGKTDYDTSGGCERAIVVQGKVADSEGCMRASWVAPFLTGE